MIIKAKAWNGKALRGVWQVTLKIDGVRALCVDNRIVSKQGKPLYNLDQHRRVIKDVEVWLGSWEATAGAVRAAKTQHRILRKHLYALDPLDMRLHIGYVEDPSAAHLKRLLRAHTRAGCDGLVLRQGDRWIKVKHTPTFDVKVLGVQPGHGKHHGRMGAVLTARGRVGTGFSDAERCDTWVGRVIEVACLGLTAGGKFRHARYVRTRFDK